MGWDYFAEASAAALQTLDLKSQFVDARFLGFRVQGFWVWVQGFRGLGFRV